MRSQRHFKVTIENRGWSKENGCNKKKKLGLQPEGRQGISIEVATQFSGRDQKFSTDEDRRSPQR